jgi:putative ABC transport system permease protein
MFSDLRYAFRQLTKNPGFTAIAVLTLALGIGANTAIFTVFDAVLLKPLPFARPEQLVRIYTTGPQLDQAPASPANFLDWKEQNRVFKQIAAYSGNAYTLLGRDMPERLIGIRVSSGFFELLGVQPSLGRFFRDEEDAEGRNQVVVLNHKSWQTRFGGRRDVIGQGLTLNDKSYTVVGVMPPGFTYPSPEVEFWTPLAFSPAEKTMRDTNFLSVIARLQEGVPLEQASAQMNLLVRQIAQQHPELNAGDSLKLVSLGEATVGKVRSILWVLLGAVGFVLLICCANVANLFLVRGAQRQKEIAIRSALGATRGQLVRLLFLESLLVALLGGAFGFVLGGWGIDLLLALKPENLPRLDQIRLDWSVLTFTGGISLATGLLFGLVPALQTTSPRLNEMLKDGDRSGTSSPARHRLRALLVVSEVALSLVLLVGAGLLIRSFVRLAKVDPGFRPDHVLAVSIPLPVSRYPEAAQQAAFFQRLLERVGELPKVRSAGAVTDVPLFGGSSTGFDIEGRPLAKPNERPMVDYRSASSGYFQAMGIDLVSGRTFTAEDKADSPPVVLINETFARRFFGSENPIGKRIGLSRPIDWRQIVGVVRDTRNYGLDSEVKPECYLSYLQNSPDYLAGSASWMVLVVRTETDPLGYVGPIKEALHKIDPDQPISNSKPMTAYLAQSIAQWRFNMLLLAVFAGLALLLAAVGIYGVISYSVAQRQREVGIRLALGAQPADVIRLIVRQGMRPAFFGLVAGILVAIALTRFMTALLFQVSAIDPLIFGLVGVVLMLVATIASFIPARRALRLDPAITLRSE